MVDVSLKSGIAIFYVILTVFPEERNAQTLYNLGTIIVSPDPPNPDGRPSKNSDCNKAECSGLVWIFYSDSFRLSQWGTINSGQIDSDARDILCRQLGYERRFTGLLPVRPKVNDSFPVWLSGVDCTESADATNILQCSHSVCGVHDKCNNHEQDLVVSCYGEFHKDGQNYYNGEVFLAGPEEKVDGMQTTFGVIQIKMYGEIRSITISDNSDDIVYFQASERDSICKQMGFTRAVTDSVSTVSAVQKAGFNFTRRYYSTSWFNINETTLHDCSGVKDTPARCFGCCFNYKNTKPGGCGDYCNAFSNALVVSCTYDSLNRHPDYVEKGNENICKFVDSELSDKKEACALSGLSPGYLAAITLAVFFATIFIIAVSVKTCLVVKRCYKRRQENYEPMD